MHSITAGQTDKIMMSRAMIS